MNHVKENNRYLKKMFMWTTTLYNKNETVDYVEETNRRFNRKSFLSDIGICASYIFMWTVEPVQITIFVDIVWGFSMVERREVKIQTDQIAPNK